MTKRTIFLKRTKWFSFSKIFKKAKPEQSKKKEVPKQRIGNVQSEQKSYESLFIRTVPTTARSGKTVYICKEHHERIIKILHVIAKNDVSLFSYIYNVLEYHFTTYKEDITELYDNNIEKIF